MGEIGLAAAKLLDTFPEHPIIHEDRGQNAGDEALDDNSGETPIVNHMVMNTCAVHARSNDKHSNEKYQRLLHDFRR